MCICQSYELAVTVTVIGGVAGETGYIYSLVALHSQETYNHVYIYYCYLLK